MHSRVFLLVALSLSVAFATESQIQGATCNLETTASYRSTVAGGFVNFHLGSGVIDVDFRLFGLAPGVHKMYIYQYGDILAEDGSTMGSIFNGNVGRLNNDFDVTVDANGYAVGGFSDSRITLNGDNSIIGRGLGVSTSAGVVQLVCVVGRLDTAAVEKTQPQVAERPLIRRATCLIRPTTGVANTAHGWVDFEVVGSNVVVEYFIPNAPDMPGGHGSHVHWSGNISDTVAASLVGGHYNNTEAYFKGRPGSLNEVGALGNPAAYVFNTDNYGAVSTQFADPWVKLNGPNSIIGRSIVLHGIDPNSMTRAAQCVIGIKSDGEGLAPLPAPSSTNNPTVNQTTRAAVRLSGTEAGWALSAIDLNGYVTFETQPDKTVRVRYFITGLPTGSYSWFITESGDQGSQVEGLNDGEAAGGVLDGYDVVRANGSPNKLGYLGDNAPIVVDSSFVTRGEFIDTQLRLNGKNSIIGRSLVVVNSGNVRVFQGTIGIRLQAWTHDAANLVVTNATCHMVAGNNDVGADLNGAVNFVQIDENNLLVNWSFTGLVASAMHPWHVHNWGDLLASDTISSVSGHFIGLDPVRPMGQPQEIGLINGGVPLTVDASGNSVGTVIDTQMKLFGINSIVGRAVVIHAPSPNQVTRIGYCVIGATTTLPFTSASAMITPSCLLLLVLIALVKVFA